MVEIDEQEYSRLYDNFMREYNRVIVYKRRAFTKDLSKRTEYKECLVRTHNEIVKYISDIYKSLNCEDKLDANNRLNEILRKLKECFQLCLLEYEFERNIYALIDIDKVVENWDSVASDSTKTTDPSTDSASSSTSQKGSQIDPKLDNKSLNDQKLDDTNTKEKQNLGTETEDDKGEQVEQIEQKTPQRTRNNSQSSEHSSEHLSEHNETMTQTKTEMMKIASSNINYIYEGDPSRLASFIDTIEFLDDLCEAQNKTSLVKFIKTKLEGKAREALTKEPETCKDIIDDLKKAIKTESSKVVEGRMLALRADKTNLTKFAERAEELAELYRNSLKDEGHTPEKAKQMSVEKTIELCRKNTRSESVQSIIASRVFSEPNEVIAKMIVEINNLKLFRNSSQYTHKGGNHKNGNHNSNNKFNKNHNSNSNSSNNRFGNKQNGNSRQNYHGNGNKNGQNHQNSRTYTNSNYRRSNDQSVRIISGNETSSGNGGHSSETAQ